MTDQTRPEILEVQVRNKAIKYQKDKLNVILNLAEMLDLDHISKLHKKIEKMYLNKFKTTDHFAQFRKNK